LKVSAHLERSRPDKIERLDEGEIDGYESRPDQDVPSGVAAGVGRLQLEAADVPVAIRPPRMASHPGARFGRSCIEKLVVFRFHGERVSRHQRRDVVHLDIVDVGAASRKLFCSGRAPLIEIFGVRPPTTSLPAARGRDAHLQQARAAGTIAR
jgi:hypothetical protein